MGRDVLYPKPGVRVKPTFFRLIERYHRDDAEKAPAEVSHADESGSLSFISEPHTPGPRMLIILPSPNPSSRRESAGDGTTGPFRHSRLQSSR
jgi:hypothetical protein